MKYLAPLLLALLALGQLAASPPVEDEIDFESLGKAFAVDHGLDGVDEWDIDFREILNKGYAHLSLGIFDVYYPPKDLGEGKNAMIFKELCLHLIGMQRKWVELTEPVHGGLRDVEKDLDTVEKWIEKWKSNTFKKFDEDLPLNLVDQLDASKKVREAVEALSTSFVKGETFGLEREDVESSPLILLPTRYEFMRLVCYAGLVFEDSRDAYWTDETHTWIEGTIMDMRAIALEYTDPDHPRDVTRGYPMNIKHDDELQQHVVQRAYLSLLRNYFGDHIDPALAVGLAINTDIDLFGCDHARLEGDPEGNSTPPREVFVPGGNPDGGYLPPLSADSHWREFEGQERFLGKLKQAQEAGNQAGQSSKERLRSFALQDPEAGDFVVSAPFLGSPAYDKSMPPEQYIGEYMEFFRAYRTGFAEFMRTAAGSTSRDSKERFAKLMTEMAKANLTYDDDRSFEDMVLEIYEVPLSSKEPDKTDLEGRFLKWLEKLKV